MRMSRQFDWNLCRERIERLEPEIRAWACVSLDEPRGLPFGVKDIFETADFPTEYGAPSFYAGNRTGRNAALVDWLIARGCAPVGKTHTTAFAYYDPAPTRNPAMPGRTPGGSSSGSAAAVAAGMVPLAIGSQTQGSVIRPAAYCGVAGYKPTYGKYPVDGAMAFAPTLDTIGFFTRAVDDLIALLDVAPCEPANVVPFEEPADWQELQDAAITINAYEGARSHERHLAFGGKLAQLIATGLAMPEDRYRAALATLGRWRERFADRAGVWMTEAAPWPPPEGLQSTGDPVMNRPWTALGCPAITVPTNVQLIAAPGADDLLLRTAACYPVTHA